MGRPENEIAAPQRLGVDGCAERLLLHVAVARAGNAAGVQRDLHEPRTIETVIRLAAPEIGRAQKALRHRDEIALLRPKRRDMRRGQKTNRRYRKALLLARDREPSARRPQP